MNKKIVLMILVCLMALGNCFATILEPRFEITKSEQEFNVIYYVTEDMKVLETKQNEDVNVT